MKKFTIHAPFEPNGDQPQAIEKLVTGLGTPSTLRGVTGSGKTYTIAQVIAQQEKQVLILSPNKTLAAQLYEEFSLFFPENKVCYFVSYYDYYQPESYLPAQNIYIPKETKINSELERLRIEATASIINRPDTIIISSISCIYSLGNPTDYRELALPLKVGQTIDRKELLHKLIFIQYSRNDTEKASGTFQVRGNTIEIQLPYQKEKLRIELFGTTIESLCWADKQNNNILRELDTALIFPAKHFVTTAEKKQAALASIRSELQKWLPKLGNQASEERLKARVENDLEMLAERGHCPGIENYSFHFDTRQAGEQPSCLFDFFQKDFLFIIDESHIALPQLRAMYAGDKSRKQALVDFGFRLPSALENRPLQFSEIENYLTNVIYVSATPGEYELSHSTTIADQIIRPTGLLDPEIKIHSRTGQIENLLEEIEKTKQMGFRTLVTVLTKKMAEDLAHYLEEKQVKVCYMHSTIKTPVRTELLHKLRAGIFDCMVGVNLLREGLDLPEVALVAIMDADIESFLRDKRSLIQIIGRAARNINSQVILYTDSITGSMQAAIDDNNYKRSVQIAYNQAHGIIPQSVNREVTKAISPLQQAIKEASYSNKKAAKAALKETDIFEQIKNLEKQMVTAAEKFDFEKAIELRAEWLKLKKVSLKK